MIDSLDALSHSAANFPKGPESLIEYISSRGFQLEVLYEELDEKCDGWCVKGDASAIICINVKSNIARQRFTLAHELAHLILGSPPDISALPENYSGPEEQMINNFAAQMLLPREALQARIDDVPVTSNAIARISKEADVSEMMVARRIVSLSDQLGIHAAMVAEFVNGRLRNMIPREACPTGRANELLGLARGAGGEYSYRRSSTHKNLAIVFDTPWVSTLIVQSVLSSEPAASKS